MLTLAQFAAMTISVLASDGIDGYLPTLVSRENRSVRVLEGIPADVDHRKALQDWIVRVGTLSSHLFAVRSGAHEITAGSCVSSACEFVLISDNDAQFETKSTPVPDWWHITL